MTIKGSLQASIAVV